MSDQFPVEAAAGQMGQTAAVALQALVLMAQAVREHQRRQAAGEPAPQQRVLDPQTERHALAVREHIRPPELAEALINGPGWPQLSGELQQLERAGVDVREFLRDAAPLVARIDADLRAAIPQPGLNVTQAAQQGNAFPLPRPQRPTLGERIRARVDRIRQRYADWRGRRGGNVLGDRAAALAREGIGPQQNARLVVAAREAIADEHLLGQLVAARQWPAIAGQMQRQIDAGRNPREALAGIPTRVEQAAAAGIRLHPAEAAQALLNQPAQASTPTQAATPAPQPVAASAPSAQPTAAAPQVQQTAAAPATTQAAAQRETVYRWQISQPTETSAQVLAQGEAIVPAGPGEREAVEQLAARELAKATNGMAPDDARRITTRFSGIRAGGTTADNVYMNANHAAVLALPQLPRFTPPGAAPGSRAAAANSRSTTASPAAAPSASPTAAAPSTAARTTPRPGNRPTR